MKRSGSSPEGSLDLLLDTICNTFGGVLFISILVVVLLNLAGEQASEEPPDAQTQVELVEAQLKLDERQEVLRKFQAVIAQFQYVDDEADSEELRKLLADLRAVEAKRAAAIEKRNQFLNDMSKQQIDTNNTLEKMKRIRQERRDAEEKLADAQEQLSREKAKRSQKVKPSVAHKTTKEEVVLFLREGRLCTYGSIDSSGNLIANPTEWSVKKDAKGRYVEPRPTAGMAVKTSGSNALVQQKIARFNRTKHYLAVFVWPDSFTQFAPLKEILLKEKFEYRLVPLEADGKVYAGSSIDPNAREVQGN